MNQFTEHFNKVKALAGQISPPSRLRLILPSFLVISSLFTFIICPIFFVLYVLFLIFTVDSHFLWGVTEFSFYYFFVSAILATILFKSYLKSNQNYKNTTVLRREFKLDILPKIISSKYDNLNYRFDGMIDEKHILASDFFSPSFLGNLKNRWFFGDDHFSGKINDVDFEFCELYYKTEGMTITGWALLFIVIALPFAFLPDIDIPFLESDSGGDSLFESSGSRSTSKNNEVDKTKVNEKAFLYGISTNFRGFFLYADFHKHFDGQVNIRTKKKFNKKMFGGNDLKTIRVENSIVTKKYTITATDEQMAYYILSPKIIDAIVQLNQKLGEKLSLTLKDGKLFLIMPMSNDLFENITVEKDKIKVNTLEEIQKDLNIIADLISELNLNTKIWSKV